MYTNSFQIISMAELPKVVETKSDQWLWRGYLHGGDITLLTSQWKTGKTTLLTGLLRQLELGGEFLGRPLRAGRALVVSEESPAQWADRLKKMPVGGHVQLLARPFRGRPSVDEWNGLIEHALTMRQHGELDLFVVDPLASFLTGRSEADAATLLEALQPLHRLAVEGVAILLLHHPRKKPSEEGQSARGSGALLGFVDIILELNRYSKLKSDRCRRRIVGQSRRMQTPERLAFEWEPVTGEFKALDDPLDLQFEENWNQVLAILQKRKSAASHHELLLDWPADQEKPSPAALYRWLDRAHLEKRILRSGDGTSSKPWRYRLKSNMDEELEKLHLPRMKELGLDSLLKTLGV